MKKLKLIFLLIILIILKSCWLGKWSIDELYALKIEGTSKVMYKYDAWGGRDSHISGFVVLDSTKKFQVDVAKVLPFYHFADLPNKNKIVGVSDKCDNSCGENYEKATPVFKSIERKNLKQENIPIENIIFQYKGFAKRSSLSKSFHFEYFKETKDSLIFYNLENKNIEHLDSLKFKKKMVYIRENENAEIIKLILEDIVIKNNEIQSFKTYLLTPKNKTKTNAFSDNGIFKPVKN